MCRKDLSTLNSPLPSPVAYRPSNVVRQHWRIQEYCNHQYSRKSQEVRIKTWHSLRHLGAEANGEKNHEFQETDGSSILQNIR